MTAGMKRFIGGYLGMAVAVAVGYCPAGDVLADRSVEVFARFLERF